MAKVNNINPLEDSRFKTPSNIMLCGPTQSGKTTFLSHLLDYKNEMFTIPPKKIIYCYGSQWQPMFDNLIDKHTIEFIKGIPQDDMCSLFQPHEKPGLIILDDLMNDAKKNDDVSDLFTKGTHHHNVSCIFICQNPFPGGKHGRTISTNTHYNVLFKNPRDSRGVRNLMEQVFPYRLNYAMDSYCQAIKDKPYAYLLLDLHQTTPDTYRLRSNILPFEKPHYCYIPK